MRPEITAIVEAGLAKELKSLALSLIGEDHRAAALALALIDQIETTVDTIAIAVKGLEAIGDAIEAEAPAAEEEEAPKKRTRRTKAEMEAAKKQTEPDVPTDPVELPIPTVEEARAAIAAAVKRLGAPVAHKILAKYGPSLSAFTESQRRDALQELANA
jgi:septal ring factor EnvC (AmiA/AmiB activator)